MCLLISFYTFPCSFLFWSNTCLKNNQRLKERWGNINYCGKANAHSYQFSTFPLSICRVSLMYPLIVSQQWTSNYSHGDQLLLPFYVEPWKQKEMAWQQLGGKNSTSLQRLTLSWLEACCWINSYSLLPFPTSLPATRLCGAQGTFFSGLGGTQHLKDPAQKALYDDNL